MLEAIRKRQKFLLTIFITLISIVFIFWGFYGDFGTPLGRTDLASVNGKRITLQEFQSSYENTVRMYQNILKDRFTPEMEKQFNLKQVTLNELIDQQLVVSGAEKLGLKTTDAEVRDQIVKLPYFQKEGKFDKDLYLSLLKTNRIAPPDFENNIRTDLLQRKVITLLRSQVKVSPEEALKDYVLQNDKVNIRFVQINPDALGAQVSLTPQEKEEFARHEENLKRAQNYYTSNRHLYKTRNEDGGEGKEKTFEEVKSDIFESLLSEDKRSHLAGKLTEELWKNRNDKDFLKLLKREKLSWEETGLFPRGTKFIPKIGEAAEIMDHAFRLKKGAFFERSIILKNRFYILKIKDRQSVDLKKFPKNFDEKQELNLALNRKQYDAYTQWLRDLRSSAKIKIRKGVLEEEN